MTNNSKQFFEIYLRGGLWNVADESCLETVVRVINQSYSWDEITIIAI